MRPARTTERLLSTLKPRRRDGVPGPDDIDVILVVELTRMGDVLSMLPAVRVLASGYPSAAVHLFVDERYAPLLQGMNLNVEAHGISRSRTVSGLLRAVRHARLLKPGLACSMSPAKRNVLVALGSGSRFKVGYLHSVHSRVHHLRPSHVESRGFTLPGENSQGHDHIEERAMKVCKGLGLRDERPAGSLSLRAEVCDPLKKRLTLEKIIPDGEYVVVHPFSGWRYRSWNLLNFLDIARLLASRAGIRTVFLFEQNERPEWERSLNHVRGEPPPLVFASGDLLESAMLISGAALFVGNDSGPLHLAACLGIPRLGLFGPSSPSLSAPRGENGTYLYRAVECSPCRQVTCVRPEIPCINLITPEEVYEAAVRTLQKSRSSRSCANG